MPLEYYGIEADDNPFFDLSVYFLPVARYIRTALNIPQGELLWKALGWRWEWEKDLGLSIFLVALMGVVARTTNPFINPLTP